MFSIGIGSFHMVAKTKYTVLFNMLLVVGCGETGPDDHSQGNSSDLNSQRSVGYALQANEGEVLFGGPRGGKVIIKVDPAKTASPSTGTPTN